MSTSTTYAHLSSDSHTFGYAITRVDNSGIPQWIDHADKPTMMHRCGLPACYLRLLDPWFVNPPTILGREKAIIVNIEQIRCIITAEEVFIFNSHRFDTKQHDDVDLLMRLQGAPGGGRAEHQMRLQGSAGAGWVEQQMMLHQGGAAGELWVSEGEEFNGIRRGGGGSFDDIDNALGRLPFEFNALELALATVCSSLDRQATELIHSDMYFLLGEQISNTSNIDLGRVRQSKSRLVDLTRRVQKVRDEIKQLMDDDKAMAEMYLT